MLSKVDCILTKIFILADDTKKVLQQLKGEKVPCPDGIENKILNLVADEIAQPLTKIFNRVLETETTPYNGTSLK